MANASNLDITLLMYKLYPNFGVEYMVGGSYVVDRQAANDVDIIVHELSHRGHEDGLVGFRELTAGDEKYDEIDHMRIISIYEGKVAGDKVNIIVVGAAFWPAYMGAINEMRNNPEFYLKREDRVELHRSLCRQVADIAGIEIPEKAL